MNLWEIKNCRGVIRWREESLDIECTMQLADDGSITFALPTIKVDGTSQWLDDLHAAWSSPQSNTAGSLILEALTPEQMRMSSNTTYIQKWGNRSDHNGVYWDLTLKSYRVEIKAPGLMCTYLFPKKTRRNSTM